MFLSNQTKTSIVELSSRIAHDGIKSRKIGLVGVSADELQRRLLRLPPGEAEWWVTMLSAQFDKKELPAEYAAQLASGKLTLADLSNPLLDLGDLNQYDLSQFGG